MWNDVNVEQTRGCCGNDEIYNLQRDPTENVLKVAFQRYEEENKAAFYTFADVVGFKNGSRLAKFIVKNNLGQIVETRSKRNPNTDNRIRVWIWDVDDVALKRWWAKNKQKASVYCWRCDNHLECWLHD